MILLFTQIALGACIPDTVELWPHDGAGDVPGNTSVQVRIPGDCRPESLVVELDGVESAPAERFGLGPSVYVVDDLPDLEPGEYELLVRDERLTFRVRSTFIVSDAQAEPPRRAPAGMFGAVWYETVEGDLAISGFVRLQTGDLHEPQDLVLIRGVGPWRDRITPEYVDPARQGRDVQLSGTLDAPPEEDVCIELVRANRGKATTRSTLCTTAVENDARSSCATLSTAPAGLLALLGSLLVLARRRS